jgi:protein involved in polysaccharide export with SLBB domain
MNFKNIILIVLCVLSSAIVFAQDDLLQTKDLSRVRVDEMSENDLDKIRAQLQSRNLSIDEVKILAISKGMSSEEFAKLKDRLELKTLKKDTISTEQDKSLENIENNKSSRKQEKIENVKIKDSVNALIFGSELFDNPTLNFEPNLKLATPVNYILGSGDELQVSIYGIQEYNASIPVSVEGKIAIQHVGQIPVSGMTIEAATQKIKAAIAKVYSTVRSGQSQVSISLSRIRTIKITIIGSRQPGNYNISSLSTVYNALHLAGGPGKNGSYRKIELIRNNKIYKNIDLYRFLTVGDQSDNVGLKDNDVIRIPTYKNRVVVEGQVKRPGIFEMKEDEVFNDLLNFASGFNEFAYTASVNVTQKTNKELRVDDINESQYPTYKPKSGDVFKVTKILNRFQNRVKIDGAVFRPDTYSFYEGMRISELIAKAEGLKEDAYSERARLVRLKSDLTTEIVDVNLKKALSGDKKANVVLKREDAITIYSILDFRETYKVTIDGEVNKPGVYEYHDGLTLNDIIIQAGGLKVSSSKRVEIARMIKSEKIDEKNPNRIELFNIEISPENNEQAKNFDLKPFDVINIRRMGVYEKPEMITIAGEVAYSGKYVLTNKKEKIFDIINRAGGLTSFANLDGIKIKRPILQKQIEEIENINFNFGKNDSIQNKLTKKLKVDLKYATVPVDWRKIVKNPNSNANVRLFPKDEIEIASNNESVKVTGNVLLTSEIPYNSGQGFNYYINAVGGIDNKGWKRKAYIIYPNGKADVTRNFLFFKSYPKVVPGGQIVVPEKPTVKSLTTGEFIGISSVVASLAGVIIGILSTVNK